jgi:uncharacterized protein (TIGR00106 family)
MHQFIISASLQIVPVVQNKHPYEWVDEAIYIIRQSGIKHQIGPFATVLEGSYDDVFRVIHQVNEYFYQKNCTEWIANVQIQIRSEGDIASHEKLAKFSSERP